MNIFIEHTQNYLKLEELKFPIGKCTECKGASLKQINSWILDIENFPNKVKEITQDLTIEQLNWKYRPDGWTIKQVVHHCADSHMNSFIRFKLALTEDIPAIRPYFEDRWAELPDSLDDNITTSIVLLTALHQKWVYLLRTLTTEQLQLEFVHPEHGQQFSLSENIGIYAWHCNHHFAHIENALKFKGSY